MLISICVIVYSFKAERNGVKNKKETPFFAGATFVFYYLFFKKFFWKPVPILLGKGFEIVVS